MTAKEGNVENTSTGTERKQRAPELANSALRTVTSESRPSLREDLQASNGPVIGRTMSMSPQARWRWAIRRVITNTRRDKNQVALSRFRGQRGTSISERLKRLEDGLFSLPIGIQEEVRKEAEDAAQRAQRDTETLDLKLEKLQMQLTAQQEKAQTLSAAVTNSIFEVKADCSNLDRTCADLDRAVSKLAAIRGKLSQKARQPSQELKPPVDKAASITAVVPDMPEKVTEQPADSSSVAPLLPEAVDKIPPLTAVAQDGGGETLALDLEVVLAGPGPGAAATEAEGVPTPFTDNLEVEEEELGAADAGNAFSSEDAERIERDLESLNRRMNSTEKFHAQSLRGKLQNLQTEVSALQDAATVGVRRLQRLKDESLQAADSSVDALSAGEDVSSLLQLDEDLKDARHTLRTLELRAVALKDWQRGLRAEIALSAAQANTPGGYDSPRTFPSEDVKRDMLKVSDDLLVRIDDIASSLRGHDGAVMPFSSTLTQQLLALIQEMNNTQLQNQSHSQQPAEPSSTLSPSTGTPQMISAPTPISAALNTAALAKIKKDILAKPSVEDVRVISREGIEGAMAAALEPLRSAIESLSQEVQGLKESMGDIRATAESDRQEVRLLGKEIERMDGEGEKEREIRIARQNQQDAEQKERNIDQKSLHTEFDRNRNENESRRRRDDEDSRRRRDEEESRRRRDEEASKSATPQRVEAIQKKFIPVYLPPGVVACERNQIEISSSDERNSTAARGVHSVSPTSASQSYNVDVIAVGAIVNITSGSHSGKQGSVVDVHRATQGNDPSSSVDGAAQYLVKLEESPESNAPLTDRVVTVTPTSHPILHKRRDSEERAAPRIQIEILKMRDEIQQMEITLNSLSRDKINAYQVQQMIDLKTSSMGNAHDKVDTESFLSVEAVVRNLASELDDLRHMQSHRLTTLKKQFDESVKSMNMNQAVSVEQQDQGNFSSVITTGQCLGCGRLSAIHSNSTASTGPETFRAGFRMPLVPAPFRALAVPPGAIGGSEVESVASSVPISAVLVSKSVDLSGNQHTTLESMNLTLDTNSPHYCPTRPRTSSKCQYITSGIIARQLDNHNSF